MALDHSRLGLEKKFLDNKSGRIICLRQVFVKDDDEVYFFASLHEYNRKFPKAKKISFLFLKKLGYGMKY